MNDSNIHFDAPQPGDIRQVDDANDVIDDEEHADPDQGDIGPLDPDEDVDDDVPEEEIDDLPDVGPMDVNEEPILDELDSDQSNA